MDNAQALQRAQIYRFLSEAFLYPREDWTMDIPLVNEIASRLNWPEARLDIPPLALEDLQAAHRFAFGAAGSLCYETEYGLPHEYRQSQELADLGGFYRAFGFQMGGSTRERPDHLAVELEFMSVLALKEALACENGSDDHAEICVDAARKFVQDHLGRWFELFRQSLALTAGDSPFARLAEYATAFLKADAARLGAVWQQPDRSAVAATPFDADFSCATDCPLQPGLINPSAIPEA
ncbi:MAG: molecular chaperone TorD family protein [Chloroflexi bacterium]|nr:molecular chaperone TorD family protein [Chloroflexota bacterium]